MKASPRPGCHDRASSPTSQIYVHGSCRLAQTLIEHDLVDQINLMVFPILLGTGKRLFGEMRDKKKLRLADSKTVGEGVEILIYQPAGS